MARSDRAAFQSVLVESEDAMSVMFDSLADDIGRAVLSMAGPDGLIPPEKTQELLARVRPMVESRFIGGGGRPYDDANRPLAAFPEIVTKGQQAEIELALLRQVRILERYLTREELGVMADRMRLGGRR